MITLAAWLTEDQSQTAQLHYHRAEVARGDLNSVSGATQVSQPPPFLCLIASVTLCFLPAPDLTFSDPRSEECRRANPDERQRQMAESGDGRRGRRAPQEGRSSLLFVCYQTNRPWHDKGTLGTLLLCLPLFTSCSLPQSLLSTWHMNLVWSCLFISSFIPHSLGFFLFLWGWDWQKQRNTDGPHIYPCCFLLTRDHLTDSQSWSVKLTAVHNLIDIKVEKLTRFILLCELYLIRSHCRARFLTQLGHPFFFLLHVSFCSNFKIKCHFGRVSQQKLFLWNLTPTCTLVWNKRLIADKDNGV